MDARAKQFAEEIAEKADECCCRGDPWAKSISDFALERILSYAAERERLLAEADEVIADEWGFDDASALDEDDEMKGPILAALGRHRRRGEAPAAPTSTSCAGTQPFDANRGNGD